VRAPCGSAEQQVQSADTMKDLTHDNNPGCGLAAPEKDKE